MIRRILGGLLVALPFVALFGLYAAVEGWQVPLGILIGGIVVVCAVLGGVHLLFGGSDDPR